MIFIKSDKWSQWTIIVSPTNLRGFVGPRQVVAALGMIWAFCKLAPGSGLVPNLNLCYPGEHHSPHPRDFLGPHLTQLTNDWCSFSSWALGAASRWHQALRFPGPFAKLPQAQYWWQLASFAIWPHTHTSRSCTDSNQPCSFYQVAPGLVTDNCYDWSPKKP